MNIKHIGIIMDGNGRWARRRGLPRTAGHHAGTTALRRIVRYCGSMGLTSLTVYAFSTENVKREVNEVNELMGMVRRFVDNIERELGDDNIVLRVIGERDRLSPDLLRAIERAEHYTSRNDGLNFNIALFYGGQAEIVSIVNGLVRDGLPVTIDNIDARIYTSPGPPVDLIIRTGGEMRLSNFLLWQSAYAELYFTDCLWPDFGVPELEKALAAYHARDRRFGAAQ